MKETINKLKGQLDFKKRPLRSYEDDDDREMYSFRGPAKR